MSIGGNRSNQSSSTTSEGLNQSYGSALNLAQEGYLQNLWGAGQNLANQGAGQVQGWQGLGGAQAANQQANAYLGAGAGQVGNALGGLGTAGAYNQAGLNALGATNQAYNTLGALQNPGVDPMMGVYAQQVGQQFNRQVMPALQGQAIMGGGLGGSRAGIAQGLAASDAQRNIQNFGAQLYGQGQDRALQAAGAQGGLAQANAGMYQNAANLANQFAQTGLQGAGVYGQLGQQAQQGVQNNLAMGQFGMGIPWYAQQQFAGLLGSPIMEDLGGYGETSANASSRGKSGGFNFGLW